MRHKQRFVADEEVGRWTAPSSEENPTVFSPKTGDQISRPPASGSTMPLLDSEHDAPIESGESFERVTSLAKASAISSRRLDGVPETRSRGRLNRSIIVPP